MLAGAGGYVGWEGTVIPPQALGAHKWLGFFSHIKFVLAWGLRNVPNATRAGAQTGPPDIATPPSSSERKALNPRCQHR